MVMSSITIKGLTPSLNILAATQRFIAPSNENLSATSLDNTFTPVALIPSQQNFETRNIALSGFRWNHATTSTDTHGTLKLQSFVNASPTGTDLMIFHQDGTITLGVPINIPATINVGGATQQFIYGSGITASSFQIKSTRPAAVGSPSYTNLDLLNSTGGGIRLTHRSSSTDTSGLGTFKLQLVDNTNTAMDVFTAAVNAGNPEITFAAAVYVPAPASSGQAATKGYVDTAISGIPAASITLSGAVTGTGTTAITTSFSLSLDQITAPTGSLNLNSQKITNLLAPATGTDAANKTYVDNAIAAIPATSITLSGAVTGTGTTAITTTLNLRLDQITAPTASLNLNSQKIINLLAPAAGTDAANKTYVDTAIAAISGVPTYPSDSTLFLNGTGAWSNPLSVATNLPFSTASTERARFTTAGNFGLGTTSPNAILQLGNTVAARRFVLYETANNNHQVIGLGLDSASILRVQIPNVGGSIAFYAATSSTTSVEIARIDGSGSMVLPGVLETAGYISTTGSADIISSGDVIGQILYGRRVSATMYFQGNATVTVVTAGVWTKIAGVTSSINENWFSNSASNRLRFDKNTSIVALCIAYLTIQASVNTVLSVAFYKNGTQIAHSISSVRVTLNNSQYYLAIHATTSMVQNDYIEVWVTATVSSNVLPINLTATVTAT